MVFYFGESRDELREQKLRELLVDACGFKEGAEETSGGSADNDLACERAEVVMKFLAMVRKASWPEGYLPVRDSERTVTVRKLDVLRGIVASAQSDLRGLDRAIETTRERLRRDA